MYNFVFKQEFLAAGGKSSKVNVVGKFSKSGGEDLLKLSKAQSKEVKGKLGSSRPSVRINKETLQKRQRVEPRVKEEGEISPESEHERYRQFKEEKWREWCAEEMDGEKQTLKLLEELQTTSEDLPKEKVNFLLYKFPHHCSFLCFITIIFYT